MTTVLDLKRRTFMERGQDLKRPSLDYLSAKYKNIRFILSAAQSHVVTSADEANAPGLAHKFYGDRNYWWVICQYNGIIDPIQGFEPGMVLQLPALADVNAMLSAQDTQLLASSTVTI